MKKMIFFISICLILGCSSRLKIRHGILECKEGIYDLGKIHLDIESKEAVPYGSFKKIFFINEKGKEIKFNSNRRKFSFRKGGFSLTCKNEDESESFQIFNYLKEQGSISLSCKELGLSLYISLSPKHVNDFDFFDSMSLRLAHFVEGVFTDRDFSMALITSYKKCSFTQTQANDYYKTEFRSELDTLGRYFTDVYFAKNSKEGSIQELYFNKEFGLIAFKNWDKEFWVYDGQEY